MDSGKLAFEAKNELKQLTSSIIDQAGSRLKPDSSTVDSDRELLHEIIEFFKEELKDTEAVGRDIRSLALLSKGKPHLQPDEFEAYFYGLIESLIDCAFTLGSIAGVSDTYVNQLRKDNDMVQKLLEKIEPARKRNSILAGNARGRQKSEEAEQWRIKCILLANEFREKNPKCSSSDIREWILQRQNKPEYIGIRFPNLDQVKKFMEKSGPEGGKDYITRKK